MDIKRNIPLIVGLAIPVLMVLFVAGMIYLPGMFVDPQYDFVYAVGEYPTYCVPEGDDKYMVNTFRVEGDKLTLVSTGGRSDCFVLRGQKEPDFYVYDVASDANKQMTIEELKTLKLDDNKKSPDGFEVTYGSSEEGIFPFILFGGRDYDKRFLKGNNVSKELDVKIGLDGYYGYGRGFNFVGWVLE